MGIEVLHQASELAVLAQMGPIVAGFDPAGGTVSGAYFSSPAIQTANVRARTALYDQSQFVPGATRDG